MLTFPAILEASFPCNVLALSFSLPFAISINPEPASTWLLISGFLWSWWSSSLWLPPHPLGIMPSYPLTSYYEMQFRHHILDRVSSSRHSTPPMHQGVFPSLHLALDPKLCIILSQHLNNMNFSVVDESLSIYLLNKSWWGLSLYQSRTAGQQRWVRPTWCSLCCVLNFLAKCLTQSRPLLFVWLVFETTSFVTCTS